LTSAGQPGDISRCRENGIAVYLTKPVTASELFDALIRTLGAPVDESAPVITGPILRESRLRLHVLVAEDNVVNQRLAARMLEKLGHTVTIAANGIEAVGALDRQRFDVVLMDVQMPEMDGFAATAAIRKRDRAREGHTPIVALTAHALKGDREQCLTAGMDGYLTKPLRADELASELHRIMAAVPTEPPAPPRDPVEMATAMRYVGGDHALLAELTAIFLGDAGECLQTLRTGTRAADAEAVERAAHSLKSTLTIFGAHRSATLAGQIEVLSHDGQLDESGCMLDTLEHEVGLVTAFLRAGPWATRTEGETTR